MSRQGRSHRWGSTVHVFNRVLGQRHRLKPVPALVRGVESALVELQLRYRMKILAYAFLSNHFHLIVKIRSTHQLSAFMRDLQSRIACLSARVFAGPMLFWEPRFRSQELCTAAAIRRKVRYVCSHGTKERIVANPADWLGATSAKQMRDPSAAPRLRVVDDCGVARFRVLVLSRVPGDAALPFPTWLQRQAALIADIEAEYEHLTFTGMTRVLETPALWSPNPTGRTDRAPMVQWDCRDAWGEIDEVLLDEVRAHYEATIGGRADAVDRMVRRGIRDVEFVADCTIPDQIPRDLRRVLVRLAEQNATVTLREVPGSQMSSEAVGGISAQPGVNTVEQTIEGWVPGPAPPPSRAAGRPRIRPHRAATSPPDDDSEG